MENRLKWANYRTLYCIPERDCHVVKSHNPTNILSTTLYLHLEASGSTTTAVAEIRPGVPRPVCPDRAVHLMCLCCLKPMPKQENLPPLPGGVPYAKSQKCKYSLIVVSAYVFLGGRQRR